MIDHQLRLASTVILLRDTEQGLETLLLRRNAKLAFAAGAWVFPGGAIDQVEIEAADSQMEAAKIAAVREAKEECGVDLAAEDLAHFCNWTTPEGESRRFATWFFVVEAQVSSADILIDDGEIHEFQWIGLQQAIDLHHGGQLNLMPPTYLSLLLIRHYATAAQAHAALTLREPYEVTPRLCKFEGQLVCLYPGDAGYENSDGSALGPRHRSTFTQQGTCYVHSGTDVSIAAMDKP